MLQIISDLFCLLIQQTAAFEVTPALEFSDRCILVKKKMIQSSLAARLVLPLFFGYVKNAPLFVLFISCIVYD